MKASKLNMTRGAQALVLAALPLATAPTLAAEVWLQTGTTTVQGVPMWGYQSCTDISFTTCGPVTVPGPVLSVGPADSTLRVNLRNTLPEPTSVVINGQLATAMTPVWIEPPLIPDGLGGQSTNPAYPNTYSGSRPVGNSTAVARSFTAEALAGGGTATYDWNNLKPGTYLYQSGTHPQVQVQMGLYGAMTKDTAAGIAYVKGGTSVAYNNQVTLLYSEIDPALHAAVDSGAYGTTGPTSTLAYAPKYFLINGTPFPDVSLSPVATVPAGQNTLLRLLNASLKTHVPTINGQHWKMIAEDGNPYPYLSNPRQQYTAFLAAGKTMDVLLTPTNPGAGIARYGIFDSRHFDTNNAVPGGGMLAYLDVTPAAAAAPVFDSAPVTTGTAGALYSYTAHATDPNGDPVAYSLNAPVQSGMTIDSGTGLINWTPAAAGTYPVSVRASDATVLTPLFSDQAFDVVVAPGAPVNQPPTARPDTYLAVSHPLISGLTQVVAAPGVLANDTDPDGNPLTAIKLAAGANNGRVTLQPSNASSDGGFVLAPAGGGANGSTATVVVNYQANDGAGGTSNSTLTITYTVNRRPTAVADAFTVPRCTTGTGNTCLTGAPNYVPLSLNLVSNDSDLDTQTIDVANQLPLAVARVRPGTTGGGNLTGITTSSGGTVTISAGSVTYTPRRNFAGTDTFQYRVKDKIGLESGATTAQGWATVTITVQ